MLLVIEWMEQELIQGNKPDPDRQKLYIFSHMQNLELKIKDN
jgi:hypothetical protein